MQDGGVIAPAEAASDRRQRLVGEFACDVHGDLSRQRYARGAVTREELGAADAEDVRGGLLDLLHGAGGVLLAAWVEALEHLTRKRWRRALAAERRIGDHADQRPLERADAGVHVASDLGEGLVRDLGEGVDARALAEDRH